MAGEEWARQIIERVLKQAAFIDDDGSQNSMYDLRVGPPDKPLITIEVVGAVDSSFTETWNVGPARGPFNLWNITIAPGAHIKTLKKRLEPILQKLEAQGQYSVRVDYRLRHFDRTTFDELEGLGVEYAHCYSPEGLGKVYFGMDGTGGGIDYDGSTIPDWVNTFLSDPVRQDVIYKLTLSKAPSCHAFVILSHRGTPWPVESYFTTELEYLPSTAPKLPPPILEVWLTHPWNSNGIRWDGTAWRFFDARGHNDSGD